MVEGFKTHSPNTVFLHLCFCLCVPFYFYSESLFIFRISSLSFPFRHLAIRSFCIFLSFIYFSLFLCFSFSFFLSIFFTFSLSLFLCFTLSLIYLSLSLSFSLSIFLSLYLSFFLSIFLSFSRSLFLPCTHIFHINGDPFPQTGIEAALSFPEVFLQSKLGIESFQAYTSPLLSLLYLYVFI
jgi:hypothetical protein